jgi:hypothetical protein
MQCAWILEYKVKKTHRIEVAVIQLLQYESVGGDSDPRQWLSNPRRCQGEQQDWKLLRDILAVQHSAVYVKATTADVYRGNTT